jgi:predicted RNA binding protein YcfA (HicA-like mRNA interferase family)
MKRVSGKELLNLAKKKGFIVTRIRGSHHFVQKEELSTIIPVHNNRDLGKGLVLKILNDLEFSKKDLGKK